MKLTIDSSEPLNDALRVVGAMYNVTLQVSGGVGDAGSSTGRVGKAPSKAAVKSRQSKVRSPRKQTTSKRARTGTRQARPASNSAVRAWARENGYGVADRGRIPAEVVTAYRQSEGTD